MRSTAGVVSAAVCAVLLAGCGSTGPKQVVRSPATTTTTTTTVPVAPVAWLTTYGSIFATLLNDIAAANGSGGGDAGLHASCVTFQTDVQKAQSFPRNANASAAAAFSAMLNTDMTSTQFGQPVDDGTLAAAPTTCVNDPDPLDTLGNEASNDHITLVFSAAPPLIEAAQKAAQSAAAGVAVPAPNIPVTVTPQVVANQSGSGAADLPVFTIPTTAQGWTLTWSYNCASFGFQGNFIVSIYVSNVGDPYNQGTPDTSDPGVNELGISGSRTENYSDAGTFAVKVNSECSWTVSVSYTPSSPYSPIP